MTTDEIVRTPGIGDRIRDARIKEGLTQGELAGNDYSVSYISAVERNKIRPSLRALSWLASKLNINLSDLLAVDVSLSSDALTGGQDADDEVQAAIAAAQIAIAERKFAEARDQLVKARNAIKLPSQRIQVNLLLGEAYVALDQANEAKDVLEQNLILTRDVDPVTQEISRNLLGVAYGKLRLQMMALECHRQCLIAIDSRLVRDPSFELSVLNNLGNDFLQLGQHDEAVKIFERASVLGQKMLTPQALAELYWEVSDDYRREGAHAQAQRFADMAAEHLRTAQNRQIFAHIQSSLGMAYAEKNDNTRAESTLQNARDLAERSGDADSASMALASLSRVQLARKETAKALESAKAALASVQKSHNKEAQGRAYLAMGEALSASGQGAEADKNFTKGLKLLEEAGSQGELARAYEHYADLLAQRGDDKKAFEMLKAARAITTAAAH